MIQSKRERWIGYTSGMGEMKNIYRTFNWKTGRKRSA
jgi:hypothetical protein